MDVVCASVLVATTRVPTCVGEGLHDTADIDKSLYITSDTSLLSEFALKCRSVEAKKG